MYTYIIVNVTTTDGIPCESMMSFVKVMEFCLSDPKARQTAINMDMIPVTEKMAAIVKERILGRITCHGRLVVELIEEDRLWRLSLESSTLGAIDIALIVGGSLLVFGLVAGSFMRYK